jgi:hypothetical protein
MTKILWTSTTLFVAIVLVVLATARATGTPSPALAASPKSAASAAPARLSETGLFAPGTLNVDEHNRFFSPQYPLWSDGARKTRWVYLPRGTRIDATDLDAWVFPVGTKFWKEFSFNGRRVETRLLWRASERGWVFASYKWNDEQTDATLASADGEPGVAEIAPGKRHSIPSIDDCHACHDSANAEVLGFNALQLSTDRDPNAIHGEPLTADMVTVKTLLDQGLLKTTSTDLVSNPPRIDATTPRTRAVLGYLSTNCGVCHNGKTTLAELGMLLTQPSHASSAAGLRRAGAQSQNLALETTIGQPGTFKIAGKESSSMRLAPGAPDLSALLYRMKSRRPSSQMPPLGTVLPDGEAIAAVTKWIEEDLAER